MVTSSDKRHQTPIVDSRLSEIDRRGFKAQSRDLDENFDHDPAQRGEEVLYGARYTSQTTRLAIMFRIMYHQLIAGLPNS